jgi:hypothetical protein
MTTLLLAIVAVVYIAISCFLIDYEEKKEREKDKMGKLTKSDLRELIRGDFFSQN